MLFSKKKKFEITEKQIKEEIRSPDGAVILKINLKYPQIDCPKNDKMKVHAKPLYEKIAIGFSEYAKTELSKKALDTYNAEPNGFSPFSAVMCWESTYLDESYLSILLDISVSDSKGNRSLQRKTQVWDRKSGLKCDCLDFISAHRLKEIKKANAKGESGGFFHKDLFVLRDGKIEFFIMKDGGYIPLSVSQKDEMSNPLPTA